jgi:uncharacterized membrane protein
MKKLTTALAFFVLILLARTSFAWFQICDTKANNADMWVTYAYYDPNIQTVYTDACGSFGRTFSPQYYNAWKNTGWWHLNANECATVYSPALSNTHGYVYALIGDGSSLTGANVSFQAPFNFGFAYHQYISGPFGSCSGECIGQSGSGSCAGDPGYNNVMTLDINQGSNQNFKLNIY